MALEHEQEMQLMIDPRTPDLSPLETLRHSAAHVMAAAVKVLWPEAKLAFGPATEDGFYYDIDMPHRLVPEDLPRIEEKMQQVIDAKHPFVRQEIDRPTAIALFRQQDETYKLETIDAIPNDAPISLYQSGDFVDLCRGPHVKNTGQIRAFKLLSIAGAYWRGDESRPMLQRIYGTAFPSRQELTQHLRQLEEAKKRDHRKLGKELGLFYFDPLAPASPFFTPKGATVYHGLQAYMRHMYRKHGYQEIITPQIFDMELFKISGHYEHFLGNMFACSIDEREFGVKPMNCPSHCLLYRQTRHSYRELPLRFADFGRLHRYERAGVTHGLTRVRSFCQDDAHIFCTPDQVTQEIAAVTNMILECYRSFDFADPTIEVSTRPASFLGEIETWERAEAALIAGLEQQNLHFKINPGDGAFYGPKIDFQVRDAIGRAWQLATVQLDFQLPERFQLEFIDAEDQRVRPVMIHRAIFGSMERFFGVYLEHCAGRFPVWLAPVQAIVLPIADAHHSWACEVTYKMRVQGIRVETDLRSEKLGLKIREATLQKIPYMLVIGDKEVEGQAVAPRTCDGTSLPPQAFEPFLRHIFSETQFPA